MERYAADRLVHIVARLDFVKENAVQHRERGNVGPHGERKRVQTMLREALSWLDELNLNTTSGLWKQLVSDVEHLGTEAAMAKTDGVRSILEIELKARAFFVLHSENIKYYN